ncbi:MAG: hypothetical protein Q7S86_00115 [bacterium]|nr:hypothetical protein [bacterium]
MQVYVLLILLLGLGWSTNRTFQNEEPQLPAEKAEKVEQQTEKQKPDEPTIRADEAKKVIGFAAGEEHLEHGKCYFVLSSMGLINENRNMTCFVVLQEAKIAGNGSWRGSGTNRFYRLNTEKILNKGAVYRVEKASRTNALFQHIGALAPFAPNVPPPSPSKGGTKTSIL